MSGENSGAKNSKDRKDEQEEQTGSSACNLLLTKLRELKEQDEEVHLKIKNSSEKLLTLKDEEEVKELDILLELHKEFTRNTVRSTEIGQQILDDSMIKRS